jgi:hypothetical protein
MIITVAASRVELQRVLTSCEKTLPGVFMAIVVAIAVLRMILCSQRVQCAVEATVTRIGRLLRRLGLASPPAGRTDTSQPDQPSRHPVATSREPHARATPAATAVDDVRGDDE